VLRVEWVEKERMSQQVIRKIVGMLDDDRIERRCAAAMVLAELRVDDAKTVQKLCDCLDQQPAVLQLYALEALGAARAKKIGAQLTPLLDSPDAEVRARASALLASQGSRATAALTRELDDAPPARRRALVSIMARHHDKTTFERLLALLPDPELGDDVLQTLRGEFDELSATEARMLRDLLTRRLKDKSWMANEAGAARTVRLLGYFREAKLISGLLPFAEPKRPLLVRRAALAALRRPLNAGAPTAAVLKTLLNHADDAEAAIARAAVETLRGLKLGAQQISTLCRLARSEHAEARRFGVEALGRFDDEAAVTVLIEVLGGDDPVARDAAGRALSRLDGAGPALVASLQRVIEDREAIARLCRLLRPHTTGLKPKARRAIAELAVEALEAGMPAAEPLLELLRIADPKGYADLLREKAMKLKRAKQHDHAFALLCRLEQGGLLEEEGRYAALVSGLCATAAKKDLGRATRTTDPVLRQAVELVTAGYPVAGKLKREKALTPEDIFFLGFNFAESKDEDERDFGGALLGHLVAKSPRSKLGRSAKNKLRLVGLES
jgi:hypothetical protein